MANELFSKDIGVYIDISATSTPSWKLAVCTSSKSLSISVGSTEINNDYITIEKTIDGLNYEEVSIIHGQGNSNHILAYSTEDPTPFSGVSYYRLKQTDYDGESTYSELKMVEVNNISDIELFPNPAINQLDLIFESSIETIASLRIISSYGRLNYTEQVQLEKGKNRLIVQVSSLKPGVYILQLLTEGQGDQVQVRFVKK